MSDLKILIVDDSLFFREALARGLASNISGTIEVEKAENPFEARDKILSFDPDVMILDVEIFKNNTPAGGATIVPMVFPLIAGAGVLTTLISLKAMYDDVNILIGLAINMLWVFIVIKSTTKVQRLLGEGGIFFMRKFFGIILLAMSVKMMTENIAKLF